jgi:hypothetical protein
VRKEIKLFEDLQIRENEKMDRVISEHAGKNPASLGLAMRSAADEIDRDARRKFSLYTRGAILLSALSGLIHLGRQQRRGTMTPQ